MEDEQIEGVRVEDEREAVAEAHRAFAREIDQKFGQVYGQGGCFVLVVMVVIVIVAYFVGLLGSVATWMIALTSGLVALYGVRLRVNRQRAKLRYQVEQYCEINAIKVEILLSYFAAHNLYPYFGALFEQRGA